MLGSTSITHLGAEEREEERKAKPAHGRRVTIVDKFWE
jgi:hypothetical protein